MYRHLVAVKVCIKRRTNKRVELDRLTLNQYRFKRLDAQAMKCRRSIKQHRKRGQDGMVHLASDPNKTSKTSKQNCFQKQAKVYLAVDGALRGVCLGSLRKLQRLGQRLR